MNIAYKLFDIHWRIYNDERSDDIMEIEEEFISGFCRTCNGGQTVCCEYTVEGDKRTLTFMDCAHDRCVNHAACEIYKQAHEMER